ncbi:hypothetical protein MLD38_024771 [Melastoma candidum]|uniref:Uncharacterized protein n=1 Tax=Melastoma candidum TaxID=119954 RepID=A0ACB9NV21_9MYRT|nr:hypothetical protein MLD38_024771 [Melastoma candidum]
MTVITKLPPCSLKISTYTAFVVMASWGLCEALVDFLCSTEDLEAFSESRVGSFWAVFNADYGGLVVISGMTFGPFVGGGLL